VIGTPLIIEYPADKSAHDIAAATGDSGPVRCSITYYLQSACSARAAFSVHARRAASAALVASALQTPGCSLAALDELTDGFEL
jgi:hypothetical protein